MSSEGSDKSAHMRRLARAFDATVPKSHVLAHMRFSLGATPSNPEIFMLNASFGGG